MLRNPLFRDRRVASELLAGKLGKFRGANPLVLAVPGSGVPMGSLIAAHLGGQLDLALVQRLGAPCQPEVAIGSVDESGRVYLDPMVEYLGIGPEYLANEKRRQLAKLRQWRREYGPLGGPEDARGRTVIVVNDGVATGAAMIGVLRVARARKPVRLIAAMGVAPREAFERMREEADEVVCLHVTDYYPCVEQFFGDPKPVTAAEIAAALQSSAPARARAA